MAEQFNGFRATKPVVRLIGPQTYEVFFLVYDSENKRHFKRIKRGINSLKPSQRERQAKAHADILYQAMREGIWNPLKTKYPDFNKRGEQTQMMFENALLYATDVKRKILSKFSMYDYDGCVRFMLAAAKKTGIQYSTVQELKRPDIRALISQAKEMNEWSNKARNKYLSILKSLLSVLEDEDIISFNPAARIKSEPEEKTTGYKRMTDDDKERIASHLMLNAPNYFEYLMFIYSNGIRRKEALMLKIKYFNLTRKEITISASVAKTNCERVIPITQTILNILLNRQIWNYPPDYYLFSANSFLPGPVLYHPNTPTNWWRKLVIKELEIDCKMYSLKHKGADDYIGTGTDLDVLRTLYGHKSKLMTEVYAQAVREKYKQIIIDKSPVFAKVIEMRKAK